VLNYHAIIRIHYSVQHHAMKMYGGSRGIVRRILSPGTKQR